MKTYEDLGVAACPLIVCQGHYREGPKPGQPIVENPITVPETSRHCGVCLLLPVTIPEERIVRQKVRHIANTENLFEFRTSRRRWWKYCLQLFRRKSGMPRSQSEMEASDV